jgi:hypothetical protein
MALMAGGNTGRETSPIVATGTPSGVTTAALRCGSFRRGPRVTRQTGLLITKATAPPPFKGVHSRHASQNYPDLAQRACRSAAHSGRRIGGGRGSVRANTIYRRFNPTVVVEHRSSEPVDPESGFSHRCQTIWDADGDNWRKLRMAAYGSMMRCTPNLTVAH